MAVQFREYTNCNYVTVCFLKLNILREKERKSLISYQIKMLTIFQNNLFSYFNVSIYGFCSTINAFETLAHFTLNH